MSACLPTSMLPSFSDNPRAAAPLSVEAVIASSMDIDICVQAIVIIKGIEYDMQEPGLKLDAIASGIPASIIFLEGG